MKKSEAIKLMRTVVTVEVGREKYKKVGDQVTLACVLGIDESAVSRWPDDKIPKLRELELPIYLAKIAEELKRKKKTVR